MHSSTVLTRAMLVALLFGGIASPSPASAQSSPENVVGGGETDLTVMSSVYGAALGITVPLAMGADGSRQLYAAGLLVGAPIGFFGARAITRLRPVSRGQALAVSWSGHWGGLQGYMLADASNLGEGEPLESARTETVAASIIAGSALGLAGGMLAARQGISYNTANSAMMGSIWGSWFGAASWNLLDGDRDKSRAVTLMLMGTAGLAGGAMAGSRWGITESQSRRINMAGLIGGVAAGGFERITRGDDDPATAAYALPGSIVGLAVGVVLARAHGGEEDAGADVRAEESLPVPGALLSRSQGAWSLSAPLPSLSREPTLRPDGRDALLWKVPLLKLRF